MSTDNPYSTPKADLAVSTASPAPVLWNPDAAGAWSLLFTPVFGSALLLGNWKAIGDAAKIRTARLWLIVSIVLLLPTMILGGIGFVYIVVWYFAWQRPHTRFLTATWGEGYPRRGWTKPLMWGFGIWISLVLLVMVIMMGRMPG